MTPSAERTLAGRTAMVTGGASGQGRAIALALAARGAKVGIGSYLSLHGPLPELTDSYFPPQRELDQVLAEIRALGVAAFGQDLDVRSTDSVAAFHKALTAALGPVDILVNGRLIARGEVLVLNDSFCVRVAEILTPDV